MKKFTDFIVDKRNIILILFIILTGICLYTSNSVHINSDITKYLPSTSETKLGKEIMDQEFDEQKSSTLNVMFKNLSEDEKNSTLKELENIDGVASVEYENNEEYNQDGYTLYVLNVDDYDHSTTAKNIYETVKKDFKYEALSGSINEENKPVLQLWIVGLAIGMAMVILVILSESYIEPFLYLISIGIAVFINKGTNIIFPSVSNITNSITAILQLALSMDYSIMLSNRYRQEKEHEKNKIVAMKKALYDSFKAISSSSITTVVGLLALVFMSFTIGKDLGFVLAKGVFFSLVSIFFCLPALLLLCDNLIQKTAKKSPNFNLVKLGKYSYKTRWIQLIFIICAFIGSYFLKGNLNILYTDSQQDEVGKIFPATNQIAIVYENQYEDLISKYCHSIENVDKTNQVLCYGNTINEKLAYNELNAKLEDLGQDTKIDDYLLKIIYYNYYKKDANNKMTFSDFISFIKSDIYTNDTMAKNIDEATKNNINLLENFVNKNNMNKKRSASEIASILNIKESDVSNLFVLYSSKNNNVEMTLSQFIDFMYKEVLPNAQYSSSIDSETKKSLDQLKTFNNKNIINKKMNAVEMANLFGIDESLVSQLFLFYNSLQDTTNKLTLNEFANFTLNNVVTNDAYKNMFSLDQIAQLKLLQTLSDEQLINNKLNKEEMQNLFIRLDMPADMVDSLYKFYAVNNGYDGKMSLNEFATIALENTKDENLIKSLNQITVLTKNYNTPLDANNLYNIFGNSILTKEKISLIIGNNGTEGKITPQALVNYLLNSNTIDDPNVLTQLNASEKIMSNANNSFDYKTISTMLNINEEMAKQVYGLNAYNKNEIKLSLKEMINFINLNKDNALIKAQISTHLDLLNKALNIMNMASNQYTYNELSNIVGIDANNMKNIYILYESVHNKTLMTPYDFVNFILMNKENALLNEKLNQEMVTKLNLVNSIMASTLNNTLYNANSMASFLGIDQEVLNLLFGLYQSFNQTISLKKFTDFLINDVIPDPKYNSNFDESAIHKIKTINTIMTNSLNNTQYNSQDLYNLLKPLSDKLDNNLVDLIYIYYGSEKLYDDSWTLTVEQLINYVNDDILIDKRFENFLDNDIKNKITDAKEMVGAAKEQLVSDNYSRAILNTKFAFEDSETFDFINQTLEQLGDKEGIYVIGDSPMALEISKTFNSEMNYITILTMIFIFVVVCVTFKSVLIPLILVLIIQCAVYVTMATLTLTNTGVYFISLLIVQAILMGATIDYAIIYTSYYKESRLTMNVQDSIINAYNKSIHTILSSSSILIIVTLIVASLASAIAAKICETISAGTFCSVILILFVLPGVLAVFDRFICKDGYKQK